MRKGEGVASHFFDLGRGSYNEKRLTTCSCYANILRKLYKNLLKSFDTPL